MKSSLLLLGVFALALSSAMAKEKPARAELKNAAGETVGTATFAEAKGGVAVSVKVANKALKAGPHGIHIHAVGKCEAPDFKSAGGHFNPAAKHHGSMNPQGPHGGDMPNIQVSAAGKGALKFTVAGLDLGTGSSGLFHEGGTALVFHAAEDDLKSDPAGNAGARQACGVIAR